MKDKLVWITGASSGIGEALAISFAQQGARLILSARRVSELERVRNQCLQHTSECEIYPFDLTNRDQISEIANQVIEKYGGVDILVNNGGTSQRGYVIDTDFSVDLKLMDLNYFSHVYLTKLMLPSMVQLNTGHIVIISSVTGKFGFPLRSAYAASKHALHGFFDTLRFEVKSNNINVTMVCPGRIKTNISFNALDKDGNKHGIMDAGQENGMPADICANKIISGIKRNKKEIYIGGKEVLMVYFKRFVPSLFRKITGKIKHT